MYNRLSSLYTFFDKMLKPNPKVFQNQIQQEVQHHRNKGIALFHLFIIVIGFIQTVVKGYPLSMGLTTFAACSLTLVLLLISCKFHPELFNLTYNLVLAFTGPVMAAVNVEGSTRAWIGAQMYPTLIFFCTGSLYHLIFQVSIQLIYLNTIYQSRMLRLLEFAAPSEFLRSMTFCSTSMCLFNMFIIIFIYAGIRNAYDKVQAAEKKKDEFEKQKIFLLSFSHELRNIINSLMGNVKLAILENLPIKARNFIENADLCAESLLHLINNILDSGKVEIGDLEINPTPTNIYDTVERIWRICAEQIKAKHLYGSLKIQKDIPVTLEIDHHKLMQIFFNLIGNAVKFTQRGSVTITIEWIENTDHVIEKNFEPYPFDGGNEMNEGIFEKNQRIARFNENYFSLTQSANKLDLNVLKHKYELKKGLLKVAITDTGSGIGREEAAKLFQKFIQVSSDPSQRKLGTGLGLFITKELCERMGGEVRMFSKEGKGSSFIFCIPAMPVSPPDSSTSRLQQQSNIPKQKLKALIVDDELLSRSILENYCTKLQVEVVSMAINGLEAFNNYRDCFYKGQKVELVTMDLTMPVMDGKKAAEKIREFERENGIDPCLMMVISANCSESEIAECTDKNGIIRADFFLKKPARMDEIARAISCYYKDA